MRPGRADGRYPQVALLAEGVDRNYTVEAEQTGATVALLAEGVDRNRTESSKGNPEGRSPSSRRAWIEIGHSGTPG